MKINATLLDIDDLVNHELSMLLKLYNIFTNTQRDILLSKNKVISIGNIHEAIALEQQLYFINANIDTIEVAMLMKEGDVFEFNDYGAICLN